jgi:Domain of unknown function (DUF4145)
VKCPHCLVEFHGDQTWWSVSIGKDAGGAWLLVRRECPGCRKYVLELENGPVPVQWVEGHLRVRLAPVNRTIQVWPRGTARTPLGDEVPADIAEDYREACLVLNDSPKASAALSRRCLQNLLRGYAGVAKGNLSSEIQQVIDAGKLPAVLSDNIDAIRNIGNFAAHASKSTSSGEIVPVESHEAEWNLDVLESLFEFFFIEPAKASAKRDALNKKLLDANLPPMKSSKP